MLLGSSLLGRSVLGERHKPNPIGGASITISSPVDGATVGTGFVVSGTTSTSGDVEYRIDAGSWATLATPSGGSYSGTVTGVSTGSRTLEVRQSDDTGTTDSISLTVVTDSITITSPVQYSVARRMGGATADIEISVTYLGLPTNIEFRLNRTGGEAWSSEARSGSPQVVTLSAEAKGWGTLEVRFSNATGTNDSVADVGVGIAIAVWGQSNASGRGTNNQSAPAAGAYLYDNTGQRRLLVDPYDGPFGGTETYPAIADGASAHGSWAPRLATRLTGDGEAVLFVPCPVSSTSVGAWARNLATTSCYGASKARIDAAGGVDYVIWHQGEANATAATSESAYASALTTLVGHIRSDMGNPTVVICLLHKGAWETDAHVDPIRAAQYTVATTVTGAVLGGDMNGITTGLHLTTDTELTNAGNAIYNAAFNSVRLVVLSCIERVGGAAAASITGLRWAFFDEARPDLLTSPSATGVGESTDGSGNLSIDVAGTSLVPGQVGFLIISDTDGTTSDCTAFAAPVEVSA